jgi:hypothetical protein
MDGVHGGCSVQYSVLPVQRTVLERRIMKWKTNRKEPKEGDRRTKRKFALFPIVTDYDYTVWLETYDSIQEYRYSAGDVGFTWEEIEKQPLFVAY